MKVLLISNMYPSEKYPYYGIFVYKFIEFMSAEGLEFEKVVISSKYEKKIPKILAYMKFTLKVWRASLYSDYDLVYVHYINHTLLPLIFFRYFIRKPFVVNAHGGDVLPQKFFGKFVQKLVAHVVCSSSVVVVPSSYFFDVVQSRYNLPDSRIFVSPSGGVDTLRFFPSGIRKNSDKFRIGYVSRLDPGKGWDVLLQALWLLKRNDVIFEAVIVGSGSDEKKCIDKIRELNLGDSVNYVGGKPHDELPQIFQKMDLFVFPTTGKESLGLVGLEAMASGVPVIGSNIAALPGYIEPRFNGELFDAGDSEQLAELITYFKELDSTAVESMKVNARATALSYDSRLVARRMSDMLSTLELYCQ